MTVDTELEFHPVADIFPMMSEREFADLTADIVEHGLREPVWLHRDGRIIDGRNRYLACRKAGVPPEFRGYEGDDDKLVAFVVSLNLHRRHLNESQRQLVGARIANLGQGRPSDKAANLPLSQAEAAELLNISERGIRNAKTVLEHGVPELVEKVEAGDLAASTAAEIARAPEVEQQRVVSLDDRDAILAAAKDIQRQRKDERLAAKAVKVAEFAARKPEPLMNLGPFPVVYADPPWRYENAEDTRQIENQYPTMSLDEIKSLEVPAADDSVLFLWTTSPKLVEGLEVMQAWGFQYRTCMVWVKDKIGMGYYARQKHELLLIGKRGALPVPDPEDRPASVFEAVRTEHSAKPDLVYELLERMYPFLDRCEMFQRRPRDGWVGWGNQVDAESA